MITLVVVSPCPSCIHDHLPRPVSSVPTALMTSQILPSPAIAVPPAWSLDMFSVLLCEATPFLARPGARRAKNWWLGSTLDQLH